VLSPVRPFLLFAPRGPVPDALTERLASLGVEQVVASRVGEAVAALETNRPELVLVIPPARAADAAPLLVHLERQPGAPPVFVLQDGPAPGRTVALEVVSAEEWLRATEELSSGSPGPTPTLLLPRLELVSLLQLWERLPEGPADLPDRALRSLGESLDAMRVTLFRWSEGSATALIQATSGGRAALGREIEVSRYPELRAAAERPGAVLVEDIDRDPMMDGAGRYLAGVPIRSILCERLGPGSPLFLHAIRESRPFGLAELALVRAVAALLSAHSGRDGARLQKPAPPARPEPPARTAGHASGRFRFWQAAGQELRTPLALLRAHLQSLESELGAPGGRPLSLVKASSENLRRLERLIGNLLDTASRSLDGAPRLAAEVDVAGVLRSLAEEFRPVAERRGLTLRIEAEEGLSAIRGDRDRVERLLANLLDHSLRSATTRGQSEVRVSARRGAGRVIVRLLDRGLTLPPDRVARLFDDVDAEGGGELGLAVARQIADEMKAELVAATEEDGANVKSVAWPVATSR